ncbi:MAG: peptide deformylase [Chloroflexi bacterium]|nr:MAG: peptide deformylase [Chloroflexota bacterium]
MAKLPILLFGDPRLRQKAKRVRGVDSSVRRLADDLLETMRAASGVGLAAPQVGQLLRVIVIELPEQEPIVLINPEIVKRTGEREVVEGCLSFPGYWGKIKRAVAVTAKGYDLKGRPVRLKATDLLAQCLEHEIDHLNGILYIDYLKSEEDLYRSEGPPAKSDL